MTSQRPAFYAAAHGPVGDLWTLLHPPYTAWHLAYVAIGAALAPAVDGWRLAWTLTAFFLAVGVAAHALDELRGRPLRTRIPSGALVAMAVVSLGGAVAIGIVALRWVGAEYAPLIALGVFFVAAYNLEWFGGALHTDAVFALSWGSFAVVVGYIAQAERVDVEVGVAAAGAFGLSWAQRRLSTHVRFVRRNASGVDVRFRDRDGAERRGGPELLLGPAESALRALSWALPILAAALVAARL